MKKVFTWLGSNRPIIGTVSAQFEIVKNSTFGSIKVKLKHFRGTVEEYTDMNCTFTVINTGDTTTGAGYMLEILLKELNVKPSKEKYAKVIITITSFSKGTFSAELTAAPQSAGAH